MNRHDCFDELQAKLKALNETLWEHKADWPQVEQWLGQFSTSPDAKNDEQIQMLFLASHFMYFGQRQIRALLQSLYRDMIRYRIIEKIRLANNDTTNRTLIEREFQAELGKTRFMGVGNPSESGSHLLYYFRQESRLSKDLFINSHQMFSRSSENKIIIRDDDVTRYIFIDDLCGSGTQAKAYTEDLVKPLRSLNPNAQVYYYTLFATTSGLEQVRSLGSFNHVDAVVELDPSFKCFDPSSRVYKNEIDVFDRAFGETTAQRHGKLLWSDHPLGYKDGQLLVGFFHNTPDNTLPILWYDEQDVPWVPLFRRYSKTEGWGA